ncbi:hypothetical protein [Heyndrickxia coagulans]|uniref:hypothetical protein n=1 Tax=Heyndrickxia coagulans TaxID=1398 RepID=UPI000778FB52|nr:hypothetical protein [Heyndrickxia coagulans]KYC67212.1 hypothetical protein B4100_3848 [Heyndrickxia coagulans]
MANYQAGADALDALNASNEGGNKVEFSPFKSGTTYVVKVLGTADLITFFSYGIFKQVNSFVAKNPSKKSRNGYPVENLTPWDLAWKYHKDRSKDFNDVHGQEASKYRAKQRFAMGFFDLTSGEPIIVDLSKKQAQGVHDVIKKYEKKLGKLAFELSKTGSGTTTSVTLTPVLDLDEDLTEEQRANFDKAPDKFDMSLFDGLLYEADEAEQIELLVKAGFDVSLIGLEVPKKDEAVDVEDDDLPF